MNPSNSRITFGLFYSLSCFTIFGGLFLVFSLLSTKHISPCDWSCQLNYNGHQTICGSELPFCPELNLEQCEDYFNNPSSYSDDFEKECTLFLVGQSGYFGQPGRNSSYILSLPFYGFFINGVVLNGINFQPSADPENNYTRSGSQTVEVSFGHTNHTFNVSDQSVTLNSSGFNYSPELVFSFGSLNKHEYSSILFIESISLMGDGVLVFVSAIIFMVIAFCISTLAIFCCLRCRKELDPLDTQPLIN